MVCQKSTRMAEILTSDRRAEQDMRRMVTLPGGRQGRSRQNLDECRATAHRLPGRDGGSATAASATRAASDGGLVRRPWWSRCRALGSAGTACRDVRPGGGRTCRVAVAVVPQGAWVWLRLVGAGCRARVRVGVCPVPGRRHSDPFERVASCTRVVAATADRVSGQTSGHSSGVEDALGVGVGGGGCG